MDDKAYERAKQQQEKAQAEYARKQAAFGGAYVASERTINECATDPTASGTYSPQPRIVTDLYDRARVLRTQIEKAQHRLKIVEELLSVFEDSL